MNRGWTLRGIAAALIVTLGTGAAFASEAELALLQSFLGSYKGEGVLTEPDKETRFNCTLSLRKGNGGKLLLRAECPFVAASGAVAFNDATGGYEMALTSSVDFKGGAYGSQQGATLVFPWEDSNVDRDGNRLELKAAMTMSAERVAIRYTGTYNGEPRSGDIAFIR